jgi:hypothetical protein
MAKAQESAGLMQSTGSKELLAVEIAGKGFWG